MPDYRDKLNDIRKSIKVKSKYFDIKMLKNEMVAWLSQIKFPLSNKYDSWESMVKVVSEKPVEANDDAETGLILRLALKIYSSQNQYVISIMECFGEGAEGVGIATVFVNWKNADKKLQEKVDLEYNKCFDDILKARHTLWAQNFRKDDFDDALNCCALAILGNELEGEPPISSEKEEISITHPHITTFPVDGE